MKGNMSKTRLETDPHFRWGRRGRLFCLRWGLTIILTIVVLQWVDLTEAVTMIAGTDIRYVASVVVLAFCDRYLMAYKWATLLRTGGATISNGEAFRIYLASSVIATVVPLGVSADVFKVGRSTYSGAKLHQATASIVVDRAIGCLAVLVLAGLGMLVLLLNDEKNFVGLNYFAMGTFAGLFIIGIAIFCLSRAKRSIFEVLVSFEEYRPARLALQCLRECIALSCQQKLLGWVFILSLFEQVVQIFMNYLGGKAVGLPISASYFFAIIPLSSLVLALPISVNVFGVTEGVYILLFSLAGLTVTQSLSLSLVMRAIGLIMLVPSVLVFLYDATGIKVVRQSS